MSDQVRNAKFDHVGFGVYDHEGPHAFFAGTLGGSPYMGGPTPTFFGAQWEFRDGARLEAIAPNGPRDGFLYRFLDQRGAGIHHVTFKVDNIHQACDAARSHGLDIVGFDDSNAGWKEAFIHPKQAQSVVVQFAESHPELDEDWDTSFRFPDDPPRKPATAARVLGLRICAHDSACCRALWTNLIGGACAQTGDELVFTWKDSPMRIAATINRGHPEGAAGIEVERSAEHALGEQPIAVLGTRFVTEGTVLVPVGRI